MYTASTALRTIQTEDGALVLNVQRGRIFRLNAIASLVLTRVQERQLVSEIIREISEEFSTAADIVGRDVAELLSNLEKHGLIEGQP